MNQSIAAFPKADDVTDVRSRIVISTTDSRTIYVLQFGSMCQAQSHDPRVARDYFAAIAKAAQEIVDAADVAILAEPLEVAS